MLREWLQRPDNVIWSTAIIPIGLMLAAGVVVGILGTRRRWSVLRMILTYLPVFVVVMLYGGWVSSDSAGHNMQCTAISVFALLLYALSLNRVVRKGSSGSTEDPE